MTSALFLQIVTIVSDLIIFIFVGFYLWSLYKEKSALEEQRKRLEEKEAKIETEYRQIIQNAHNQEEKIINDAAQKAKEIISNSQYVSDSAKQTIDQALQKMINDLQNQAAASSNNFLDKYSEYLNQVSQQSANNFQSLAQNIENEMKQQMQELSRTQMANLQKEIEEHKKKQLERAEAKINRMVQEVAQTVLNKSISMEDHKKLIIDSLDKSRREGVFD